MTRNWLVGSVLSLTLAFATTASAQYTGPGPMGTGGAGPSPGSPAYTRKSYGMNKGIAVAAVAAGIGGGVMFLRHHHRSMTACVGPDGKTLNDGKNTYAIVGAPLTPDERITASGKKVKSEAGESGFEVTSVRKDLGRCEQQSTVAARR